jgi:hypothetical protein
MEYACCVSRLVFAANTRCTPVGCKGRTAQRLSGSKQPLYKIFFGNYAIPGHKTVVLPV